MANSMSQESLSRNYKYIVKGLKGPYTRRPRGDTLKSPPTNRRVWSQLALTNYVTLLS